MQKIGDHFKDPTGRRLLFTGFIWANEWEALGLPRLKPIDQLVYCHLFGFSGSSGLSVTEITKAIWGSGDHRRSCRATLDRLLDHHLIERKNRRWLAILPDKLLGKNAQKTGKFAQLDQPEEAGKNAEKAGKIAHYAKSDNGQKCPENGQICPDEMGKNAQKTGKFAHHTERVSKERNYYDKHNEISEKRDRRTKSDRVAVGVDFSKFNPLEIWQSEPHWLVEDLSPPSDPKDYETWLHFAADCSAWRKMNTPAGEPLSSPTAYASKCRAIFFDDTQRGIDAIQSALEMAQAMAHRHEAEQKSQKQRDQQAPPKIRQFNKDDLGPDDFLDWIAEVCPEFAARLEAFKVFCAGEHAAILAPHLQRLQSAIKQVEQRLERITVPRAIWGSKAQGVGQLHAILKRAREELEAQ